MIDQSEKEWIPQRRKIILFLSEWSLYVLCKLRKILPLWRMNNLLVYLARKEGNVLYQRHGKLLVYLTTKRNQSLLWTLELQGKRVTKSISKTLIHLWNWQLLWQVFASYEEDDEPHKNFLGMMENNCSIIQTISVLLASNKWEKRVLFCWLRHGHIKLPSLLLLMATFAFN